MRSNQFDITRHKVAVFIKNAAISYSISRMSVFTRTMRSSARCTAAVTETSHSSDVSGEAP